MELKQSVAAARALIKAAANYAGNEQLLVDTTSRLILLGNPQAALAAAQPGAERFPRNVQLQLNVADALRLLGRHQEAIELLQKIRLLAPGRLGAAVSLVNSLRSTGENDKALGTAQQALEASQSSGLDEAWLHNELAHCYQALGHYEEAYASICLSGERVLALPEAQAVDGEQLLRRIKAYCSWIETHGLPQRQAPIGKGEKKLAFVVGFPRSGTTLMESMLAAHPKVKTSGEAPLIEQVVASMLDADTPVEHFQEVLAQASESQLAKARQTYWKAVRARFGNDFDYFVDKQPLNTIELPLIRTLFPEAKIIIALRDPRDVCLSCLFQWFVLTPAMKPFLAWDSTVQFYALLMDYLTTLEPHLAQGVLTLKYEELVSDFPRQIRDVIDYLELPWDEAVMAYADKNQRGYFHTPSNEAVRQQVNTLAVDRWRRYPDAINASESLLGPIIDRLGYR